jgi:hypothetical protein
MSAAIVNELNTADAAVKYWTDWRWHMAVLAPGTKRPVDNEWQKKRLDEAQLRTELRNGRRNLGALLGEPSGGLCDVDIDCWEALKLAPTFLPSTKAIFGRPSAPSSHRLYQVEPADFRTVQFEDPLKHDDNAGCMIVEVRGTGAQTMFPPSIHPSKERVEWQVLEQPTHIEHAILLTRVTILAAAALLTRYWPSRGDRHKAALALAGALLRSGWTRDVTEYLIVEVARAANDEEAEARRADIRSTADKLANGEAATGGPTCSEIFSDKVWSCVVKWLDLRRPASANGSAPHGDSADVERPRPLFRAIPESEPFPLDALGQRGAPAARDVRCATKAPAAICGQSVLATMNVAVMGYADIRLPHGEVRPTANYFVSIGETGIGKTSADNRATAGIVEHETAEGDNYRERHFEYLNDLEAWKTARSQITAAKKDKLAQVNRATWKQQLTGTGRGARAAAW